MLLLLLSLLDATLDVGQSQLFTATPIGGSGSYTSYQWYVDGSAQSGQTASTFSYSPASAGTYLITVTVIDSSGTTSAQSYAATVTVNSALVAPTVTATPTAVDQNQTSALTSTTVSTGSGGNTYQWMEKAPTSSYVDVGTNSTNFSFVTTNSTTTGVWSFELQVADSTGAVVTSSAATVTVNAAPTVTVSPGNATLDVGQTQLFTAIASGGSGSLSYQWFLDGAAVGSNNTSYSYTGVAGTHMVYVNVTDSASPPYRAASNVVSVMVDSALVAPTASASPTIVDQGQTLNLASSPVTTGTPPYTYQWFNEAPGASSYSLISGLSSANPTFLISASAELGTWSFEVQVTDSTGASVNSTAASVTINSPTPTPTATPAPTASASPTPSPPPAQLPATTITVIIVGVVVVVVVVVAIFVLFRNRQKLPPPPPPLPLPPPPPMP